MQQLYRLITTSQPINIALNRNQIPQSQKLQHDKKKQMKMQDQRQISQQVSIKGKQQQQLHKPNQSLSQVTQYVSQVILISKDIICIVTKHYLQFYSISYNSQSFNHQKDRLIGRLSVENEIRNQIAECIISNLNEQQSGLSKQINLQKISIIQQKGIIYNHKNDTLYLLVQTSNNKYFVSFSLNIKLTKGKQNQQTIEQEKQTIEQVKQTNKQGIQTNQQGIQTIEQGISSNDKQKQTVKQTIEYEKNCIKIDKFNIIYDFNHSSSQVKYSLQLNPQILLLPKSQTPILIRKFYNDSLVVIFKNTLPSQQLLLKQTRIIQNQTYPQTQQIKNIFYKKKYENYWSFYINEQCLSCLDEQNFLVNYRQLITKNHAQIDIIDIVNKQKTFIRITEAIEPMTIKNIQLYLPQLNRKNKNKQHKQKQQGQGWCIRIFGILKRSQNSYILDYDIIHQRVIRRYKLQNLFIENVSFSHRQRQYYYVNYLYQSKNYIGVIKSDLSEFNNNEDSSIELVNRLIDSSVQFELNSMIWNIQMGLVVQSGIQVRNNILKIKCSKLINKSLHYIKIIDQLKKYNPILNNQQLSISVYQLLNRQIDIGFCSTADYQLLNNS